MATLIPLTQNLFAIVDDEMEQSLSQHRWCVNRGYACRMDYSNGGKGRLIYMARAIMDAPDGADVDHVNGNPLDNRRINLRLATDSQNAKNRLFRRNSSGYCGVVWVKRIGRWQAAITANGKRMHLGYFDTPKAASDVYQKAATEHFGEFKTCAVIVPEPVITKTACRPPLTAKNTSGINGVSFDNGRQRWLAYVRVDNKTIRLGRFKTQEEAIAARDVFLSSQ